MKMMPPDVISHENQLQHLSEPSIFMLDVFRTADHARQIFIPHRHTARRGAGTVCLSVPIATCKSATGRGRPTCTVFKQLYIASGGVNRSEVLPMCKVP